MNASYRSPKDNAIQAAQAARAEIRSGRHQDVTSQLVQGIVQANLAILPAKYADDFLKYCQLNPKPCPLLGNYRYIPSVHYGMDRLKQVYPL